MRWDYRELGVHRQFADGESLRVLRQHRDPDLGAFPDPGIVAPREVCRIRCGEGCMVEAERDLGVTGIDHERIVG